MSSSTSWGLGVSQSQTNNCPQGSLLIQSFFILLTLYVILSLSLCFLISLLFHLLLQQRGSDSSETDLPSVMTCANYLKLPPYSSKVISLSSSFVNPLSFLLMLTKTGLRKDLTVLWFCFVFCLVCVLQEKMKEKLIYAITEGQGSFHLS